MIINQIKYDIEILKNLRIFINEFNKDRSDENFKKCLDNKILNEMRIYFEFIA
jgi:hypothetical protein